MSAPALFVAILLHSGTNAHFLHLQSSSYSQHVALGDFYEGVIDKADKWAEAYQGIYGIIKGYPADFVLAQEPISYLTEVKQFVESTRRSLPQDTHLQNLIDEIVELFSTTLYKLKHLH